MKKKLLVIMSIALLCGACEDQTSTHDLHTLSTVKP